MRVDSEGLTPKWFGSALLLMIAIGLATPFQQTPANVAGTLERASDSIRLGKRTYAGERGYLKVPLRHAAPREGVITIGYVRLIGPPKHRIPPVFFLAGGPGVPGTVLVRNREQYISPLLHWILQQTDLYLIDQRGSSGGYAYPRLKCSSTLILKNRPPPGRVEHLAARKELAAQCAKDLRRKGLTIEAFNTTENAYDIEMLRRVLRIDRVILLGGSYGSHLGFEILRQYPQAVARALFVGVEGPDDTVKLPGQIDRFLAEIDRLRDLKGEASTTRRAQAIARRLDSQKMSVRIGSTPIDISLYDFQRWLAASAGRQRVEHWLPQQLDRMGKGSFADLARFAKTIRIVAADPIEEIMNCASYVSDGRLIEIEKQRKTAIAGDANAFPYPEICDAWGVPPLVRSFRNPVRTTVPVLMVAGTLDGRTPVANAVRSTRFMPNARILTAEGIGHSWCDAKVCLGPIKRFLSTGEARTETLRRRKPRPPRQRPKSPPA